MNLTVDLLKFESSISDLYICRKKNSYLIQFDLFSRIKSTFTSLIDLLHHNLCKLKIQKYPCHIKSLSKNFNFIP